MHSKISLIFKTRDNFSLLNNQLPSPHFFFFSVSYPLSVQHHCMDKTKPIHINQKRYWGIQEKEEKDGYNNRHRRSIFIYKLAFNSIRLLGLLSFKKQPANAVVHKNFKVLLNKNSIKKHFFWKRWESNNRNICQVRHMEYSIRFSIK